MRLLDRLLDRITMYRLMLYYLLALLGTAMVLGALGHGPYNPVVIALSAGYLTLACWLINKAFAFILKVPVNPESSLITALILALIITPPPSIQGYAFLTAAAGLAMASKYLLTIRNHNLFNPAAIAVLLTSLVAGESASWWVGTAVLLPVVLVGGVLVARKILRMQMVLIFLVTSVAATAVFTLLNSGNVGLAVKQTLLSSPLFFFAFVMLTEPLTAPTTAVKQRWYGAVAGALLPPQLHIFKVFSTPELALTISNLFSYGIERKFRLLPTLTKKEVLAPNIADFVFDLGAQNTRSKKLAYQPGQYMEWTLPHRKPDERGSRRYFTLASSPTEDTLRIGVKFYQDGSTYKQALAHLKPGTSLAAGQLGGDFVLPKDPKEKLVFIAGGIGVTPFRSMAQYLLDTRQARDVVLLYAARDASELVYREVFSAAEQQIGMRVRYVLSESAVSAAQPANNILAGSITADLIKTEIPDFEERTFYVSGPHPMVTSLADTLTAAGVHRRHIKIDFFPGYA